MFIGRIVGGMLVGLLLASSTVSAQQLLDAPSRSSDAVTTVSLGFAASKWDPWGTPVTHGEGNPPEMFPETEDAFAVAQLHLFTGRVVARSELVDEASAHALGYQLDIASDGHSLMQRHALAYRISVGALAASMGMGLAVGAPAGRYDSPSFGITTTGALEIRLSEDLYLAAPVIALDVFPDIDSPLLSAGVALGISTGS